MLCFRLKAGHYGKFVSLTEYNLSIYEYGYLLIYEYKVVIKLGYIITLLYLPDFNFLTINFWLDKNKTYDIQREK